MAFPLAQFVVLKSKSNGKYLRYVKGKHGEAYLQFCGEDVFSFDVKFEIQYNKSRAPASNQGSSQANEAEFVSIRCCYNNRYLMAVYDKWIVPEAQEPETDKSKPSCTLLKPIITDANSKTFQFRHIQLQRLLSIDMGTDTLSADPAKPTVECVVIDLDLLLKLPKRVLFKDDRGHYLRSYPIENHPCMQFADDSDKGQETVMNEVFVTGDGYVRIKSLGHGKFWRRVAGHELDGKLKDCLCVTGNSITKEAHLVVDEPVTSRKIENVEFRPEHARTDEIKGMTVITEKVTNESYTEFLSQELVLSYQMDASFCWSSSTRSMLGFKATVVTAGIPKFANGEIQISSEVSQSVQWGETVQESVPFQITDTVNVNPRTTLIKGVHATKVSSDVPFSYIQRDTLLSGDVVSDRMVDGVYSFVTWSDSEDVMTEEFLDRPHE